MQTVIIKDTGEVVNNVCRIYTQEQLETIAKKNEKSLVRSKNNFIFITYKLLTSLNIENEILTQSDITRIIYVSTYMSKSGKLMKTERTSMSKEALQEKLKLKKSEFAKLYKKIIDLDILKEKEDGLYLNQKYFYIGTLKGKLDNNFENMYIKAYIKQIRFLYENVLPKEHKQLAILFLLIPYINRKYNIICSNPLEEDANKVFPLTVKELAYILKYSDVNNFCKIILKLLNIKDLENNDILKIVMNGSGIQSASIIINPRLIYAGNDFKDVECLCVLFNKIESDKKIKNNL